MLDAAFQETQGLQVGFEVLIEVQFLCLLFFIVQRLYKLYVYLSLVNGTFYFAHIEYQRLHILLYIPHNLFHLFHIGISINLRHNPHNFFIITFLLIFHTPKTMNDYPFLMTAFLLSYFSCNDPQSIRTVNISYKYIQNGIFADVRKQRTQKFTQYCPVVDLSVESAAHLHFLVQRQVDQPVVDCQLYDRSICGRDAEKKEEARQDLQQKWDSQSSRRRSIYFRSTQRIINIVGTLQVHCSATSSERQGNLFSQYQFHRQQTWQFHPR